MENHEAISKPLLTNDEIRKAHGLLLDLDLDAHALLVGVEAALAGQMPRGDAPGEDLLFALHRAVEMGRTLGHQVPIVEILKTAIELSRGRREVIRLEELLGLVQERLAEREPTTPSVSPTAVSVAPPPLPRAKPPPPGLGAILMAGAVAGVSTALAIHLAMPHRFEDQPALAAGLTDMIVMGLLFGPIGLSLIWATRRVRPRRGRFEAIIADVVTTVLGALLLVSAHAVCTEDVHVQHQWQWLLSLGLFGGAGTWACLRTSTFGAVGRQSVVVPAVSAAMAGGAAFGLCAWTTLGGEARASRLGCLVIIMYSNLVFLVSAHGALLIRAWLSSEPPEDLQSRRRPRSRPDLHVLAGAVALLVALPLARRLFAEPARPPGDPCTRYPERALYLHAQEDLESRATEIVFLTLRPSNAFTTEEYIWRIGITRVAERFSGSPEPILRTMARRGRTLQRKLANGELSRLTVLFVEGEAESDLQERRADLRGVIARRYLDLVTRIRPEAGTIFLCGTSRATYDAEMGALDGAALIVGDDGEHLAIGRQLQTPLSPMEEGAMDRICPRARSLALSRAMRDLADRCSREETEETLDRIEAAAIRALGAR